MPSFIELRTAKDDGLTSSLDEIAREGARRMLAQALEAEVADYIACHQERDERGRAKVVRNGKTRPRKVTLGSGTIEVRAPRVDFPRESASSGGATLLTCREPPSGSKASSPYGI